MIQACVCDICKGQALVLSSPDRTLLPPHGTLLLPRWTLTLGPAMAETQTGSLSVRTPGTVHQRLPRLDRGDSLLVVVSVPPPPLPAAASLSAAAAPSVAAAAALPVPAGAPLPVPAAAALPLLRAAAFFPGGHTAASENPAGPRAWRPSAASTSSDAPPGCRGSGAWPPPVVDGEERENQQWGGGSQVGVGRPGMRTNTGRV